MRFFPSVSQSREHERATWFVVHPKGLVASRDGDRLALPGPDDVARWGLRDEEAHRLGSLDATDA
jgi:hypothetical protein